jgi:hypothetical protein
VVVADWYEGEEYKMHFPQLPDPDGWDVDFHDWQLGDDWKCSETGFVDDIHFWYSWARDIEQDIPWVQASIWSNDPGPPSKPRQQLWSRKFSSEEFVIAGPWDGDQGWYHPLDIVFEHDHFQYWQINIRDIDDPFEQQEGVIYWLVIKMPYFSFPYPAVGWKTSKNHWNDNAVFGVPGNWNPLWDPLTTPPEPIDFAFVITEEPTPLIVCEEAIEWLDVKPEEYVTETFGIGNNGEPGSLLNWHVDSWPTWGSNWTFSPLSGSGLVAGTSVTVTVSCKAPNQPNQAFSGQIEVCNSEDTTQCCTIPVTLKTPKNKALSTNPLLTRLLERLCQYFPMFEWLLYCK